MRAGADDLRLVLRDENDNEREWLRDWFALRWNGTNLTVVDLKPDAYASAKARTFPVFFFRLAASDIIGAATPNPRHAAGNLIRSSVGPLPHHMDQLIVTDGYVFFSSRSQRSVSDMLTGLIAGSRLRT